MKAVILIEEVSGGWLGCELLNGGDLHRAGRTLHNTYINYDDILRLVQLGRLYSLGHVIEPTRPRTTSRISYVPIHAHYNPTRPHSLANMEPGGVRRHAPGWGSRTGAATRGHHRRDCRANARGRNQRRLHRVHLEICAQCQMALWWLVH